MKEEGRTYVSRAKVATERIGAIAQRPSGIVRAAG